MSLEEMRARRRAPKTQTREGLVNQLRWKLQNERKQAQNALRPPCSEVFSFRSSFDSQASVTASVCLAPLDEPELRPSVRSLSNRSPGTVSSPGTAQCHSISACSSPLTKPGKQIFYPKIERFHRPMLQREIFRQKFDFLYRKIKDEVDDELSSMAVEDTSAQNTTQLAENSEGSPTVPTSAQLGPCTSRVLHRRRRAMGRGRGSAPGRTMKRAASAPGGRRSNCQGLAGVYEEYYEGDDVLIHEDVLHCSNPRLFPLRDLRHSRPFPVTSLTTC